ncbi:Alpha/Beta hydrolase protein [Flagelloscypha sp. PMI_526]|nr:Alpha/Beta hydrolase protein [Flagelloscypha sp. PMI_526]
MNISTPIDLVYKTVSDCDISLDVYLPEGTETVPVVLWWHGGGLLQGWRKTAPPHFLRSPSLHKTAFISADYRLAPQVKLPDILADCLDAIQFLSSSKFKEATHGRIDETKLVIAGGSAGGWLALLVGYGIGLEACGLTPLPSNRLKGVLAIYPITDLEDRFWTEGQKDGVTYIKRVIKADEVAEFLNPDAKVISWHERTSARAMCYHYMVQEGIETELLLNGTPFINSPSTFSVAPFIKSLDKPTLEALPPTYIIHGTIDDKVPIRQSTDVLSAMKEAGVGEKVVYEEREGADHLFDFKEEDNMEGVWDWIVKHVS